MYNAFSFKCYVWQKTFVNSIMACTPGIVLSRYYFQFQASKFILNIDCNLKYIVTHILRTLLNLIGYKVNFFPNKVTRWISSLPNLPHSWSFPCPWDWPNGTLQIQLHGGKVGLEVLHPGKNFLCSIFNWVLGCFNCTNASKQFQQSSHLVFETHCNYCTKQKKVNDMVFGSPPQSTPQNKTIC